ncbi:MAG: SPOR domain-containing protein [Deltaproteobacteria bacterium]|nr:SPOR domain-containing protein [bacterium]MCB9476300.1 SPOR domain-containing protein [Deltaproteobacteria bacterium]MCB9479991.1 SPOR domain-containing protein [Deltaproteobacteria bacterium]MCB9489259.1 SPOR domain-containing protein [Deltaproteobacteria bacterium]
MRDLRKFRNKLTLELDNRQIVFLFAGLVAVLAIVFALGVVVGKGLTQIEHEEKRAAMAERNDMDFVVDESGQLDAAGLRVTSEDLAATPAPTGYDEIELVPSAGSGAAETPPPTAEEILKTATAPAAPAMPAVMPTPPGSGGWTVQLSAHENEAEAKEKQRQYVAKGIQAYIVRADLGSKGVWYRVRVGAFKDRNGAVQYANAIAENESIAPFIAEIP